MLVHLLCSKKSESRLLKVSGKGFEEFFIVFVVCILYMQRGGGHGGLRYWAFFHAVFR